VRLQKEDKMNQAKVRAFFREFPILKPYGYQPDKVFVSRFSPEFLDRSLKVDTDGIDCWHETIHVLDREGKELAQVCKDKVPQLKSFWKRIFSRSNIASWKEVRIYEKVYETLLRLRERGQLGNVHYALSFLSGTLTLLKTPKGVDLSDWIDWLHGGGKTEELLRHEKQIRREQSLIHSGAVNA